EILGGHSSPPAAGAGREERRQALLLAVQRRVNPDTDRLPADKATPIYADLAREFGLEPGSVAAYLPSTIKPTQAEILAYARSRRSAVAAERRELRLVAAEPVGVKAGVGLGTGIPAPPTVAVEEHSPAA